MYAVKKKVNPSFSKGPKRITKTLLRVRSRDLFSIYVQSSEFRSIVDNGNYVYVAGYFVVEPIAMSIFRNKLDKQRLPLALHSIGLNGSPSEYCITYETIKEQNSLDDIYFYASPRMFRRMHAYHAGKYIEYTKRTGDEFEDYVFGSIPPPPDNVSFGELLKMHMEAKKMTVEKLASETGLDEKTIQRYRNDSEIRPAIRNVVAICLALHLLPSDSFFLLRVAGYFLRNTATERAYRYLLNVYFNESVFHCNRVLLSYGFEPLTKDNHI